VGLILVLAIRLTVPLAILRWPFAGSLLALAADAVDIIIFQLTEFPALEYQRFDKILDVYYIALQAIVAQRWAPSPRWTANALFAYRMSGTLLYELTDVRELLFVFPNVFTFFFICCAGMMTFRPDYALTPRRVSAALAAVFLPTMALEYSLHYAKWLDNLVAVDIIDETTRAVLDWLRDPLR
jgi:hypothetical protein